MPLSTRSDANLVLRDVSAGGGLGLLAGLLLGLSVSETIASVIAALVALLGAFFGLRKPGGGATDGQSPLDRPWRMASFGLVCALALVAGIALRAHDLLSEPVGAQVTRLQHAGFPPDQALALVAYQRFGIVPKGVQLVDAARVTRRASTALFGANAEDCSELGERRFRDAGERLDAFRRKGNGWKAIADAAQKLPPGDRSALLDAAWTLACNS